VVCHLDVGLRQIGSLVCRSALPWVAVGPSSACGWLPTTQLV